MSRFLVLLGGDLHVTPRLLAQIAGARVIAADSGIRHAATLSIQPELWVGDFDSADPADLERFAEIPQKTFPPAKDRTDGELAVDEALALGATEFVLAGAFGGARPDHAFLHLTLAMTLAERDIPVLLSSGLEEGRPLLAGRGSAGFDYADGTLFSVLAFSALSGLSLSGARWPLSSVEVEFGSSLTLSNAVENGPLAVALENGRALLLAYPSASA